jgi:hypothetical protein
MRGFFLARRLFISPKKVISIRVNSIASFDAQYGINDYEYDDC